MLLTASKYRNIQRKLKFMTDTAESSSCIDPKRWVERYGNYLFRYAMVFLREEEQAEDAVQECLLAALEASRNYAGKSSEKTWLTGILKHKIVDSIRRQSREKPLDAPQILADSLPEDEELFDETGHWFASIPSLDDPASALEKKRFWLALDKCIAAMPPKLAQLFMLRELAGMDTDNICKDMQITSTNLWTMLYRSRMNLRECLEINWPGNR